MCHLRFVLLWSCLSSVTVLGSAQAGLTYDFTPSFYHTGATGPSSGSLTLADGIGFGDTFKIAGIVDFQFSHTFSPSTTATFTTTDLTILGGFTYQVAEDGQTVQGFIGSQITAVNASDQRLRLALNSTLGNDNYVIDNPATSSNGALGGAFGTFTLVTDPVTLAGDYNNNGIVDAADYTVWQDNFGSTTDLVADGNSNGTVDAADYTIWQDNFGNTSSASVITVAVPEPASALVLLGISTCLWLGRHRRAI